MGQARDSADPEDFTVLCCPDKFRGALSAPAAADCLAHGVEEAGGRALRHPLADGGEGTRNALLANRGRTEMIDAVDAKGSPIKAPLGWLDHNWCVIETAEIIGLGTGTAGENDPMVASSDGVGIAIRTALDRGAQRILVAVGGSATVDGGLGALRQLGAKATFDGGGECSGGLALTRLEALDLGRLDSRLRGKLTFALDVEAPLFGPHGAALVFGPQKGAGPAEVESLDRGLESLARMLEIPAELADSLGAGGGLVAPFAALAGARFGSGAEMVLDATRFEQALSGAALSLTGEGKVDQQSGMGKTVAAVVAASRRSGVPSVVVGGQVDHESSKLYELGAAGLFGILRRPVDLEDALEGAAADLQWAGRALTGLAAGGQMPGPQ